MVLVSDAKEKGLTMKNMHDFILTYKKRTNSISNDIAVIGMACRFPGANDYEQFWDNLVNSRSSIVEIPKERWTWENYVIKKEKDQTSFVSRWLGLLDQVDTFDARFFHLSNREVMNMDPQQRISLEVAWNCFEDAAVPISQLKDRKVGVFVAGFNNDFYEISSRLEKVPHYATGTAEAVLANRISYLFDFDGPSYMIDAACAGSSVAIHNACQALNNEECSMALAGGVNLILSPTRNICFSQMGMLSPTGACKTFDEAADGYVRSEGCGFLLLKPLKKALADGDSIHAVIKGSAINHCGKGRTLTYPSSEEQANVIIQAMHNANVPASSISYVEAHGTGTPKGDPIEFEGLAKAYSTLLAKEKKEVTKFCGIGSVKANIGHLESAAGIAGVIKVILAMKHKKLPPLNHYQKLNPKINMENTPFYMVDALSNWEGSQRCPLRAGVSSFGFGGVNTHIVLEQINEIEKKKNPEQPYLICISAKTQAALKERIKNLQTWLDSEFAITDLRKIAGTLLFGREHFEERISFIVKNLEELKYRLNELQKESVLEEMIEKALNAKEIKTRKQQIITSLRNKKAYKDNSYTTILQEVSVLYIQKEPLDWDNLFGDLKERAHLPGYPFEKEQFKIPTYEGVIADELKESAFEEEASEHKFFQYKLVPFTNEADIHSQGQELLVVGTDVDFMKRITASYHVIGSIQNTQLHTVKDYVTIIKSYQEISHICWVTSHDHTTQTVGSFKDELLHVFAFVKALIELNYAKKAIHFTLLSKYSCTVGEHEQSEPYASGLAGFVGTLAKEYPLWNVSLIDADDYASIPVESCFTWNAKKYGNTILIRNQKAYIRELTEVNPDKWEKQKQFAFREGGVYVIIGGAGGIGMHLSKYLVKNYHAQLIWIGRSEKNEKITKKIDSIKAIGKEPFYVSANTAHSIEMTAAYTEMKKLYPTINGVIHSAVGRLDESIGTMTTEAFREILEAKVDSAINVANAFGEENLDFMLFFSSIASYQKLSGQCGYTSGCNFLDEYAKYLNQQRNYPVKVINWGFWGNVGIGTQMPESAKNKLNASGLKALDTELSMKAIERILRSDETQAFYLNVTKEFCNNLSMVTATPRVEAIRETDAVNDQSYKEKLKQEILQMFAMEFALPVQKIRTSEHLDLYGLDSIISVNVTEALAQKLPGISSTLLYEYHTIDELTNYIWQTFQKEVQAMYQKQSETKEYEAPGAAVETDRNTYLEQGSTIARLASMKQPDKMPIAVIGMSGRFPQADNLDEFWQHLCEGRDSITTIPENRWCMEGFYEENQMKAIEEHKSYCKWGGFLEDATQFDAEFFHISPKEAVSMDPQERIFLEESWKAFEDAGYSKTRIHNKYAGNVGVFAGITRTGYEWYGPELSNQGQTIRPTSAFSSLANRVSYFMDLHGPSMPVDTMCSSSLVAIHLACESLRRGECAMALAGGVNLYSHPSSYIYLSSMMMLSPTGRCHSFGEDADGFVPGEGVGAILLKPLKQAIEDGDHIYGVIRETNMNHNGRTNGYTVPNPNAQAQLIRQTLNEAGVNARLISYVEAHGTGTKLGDPIEIVGLSQAMRKDTKACNYCSIGSVKSNIGHLEAAAGITGVIKTLLQMQYQTIVKSLHSDTPNHRIDFEHSPFVLQHSTEEWKRPCVDLGDGVKEYPRYAGVSSFGAGGTNAFVLLEEYEEDSDRHI